MRLASHAAAAAPLRSVCYAATALITVATSAVTAAAAAAAGDSRAHWYTTSARANRSLLARQRKSKKAEELEEGEGEDPAIKACSTEPG